MKRGRIAGGMKQPGGFINPQEAIRGFIRNRGASAEIIKKAKTRHTLDAAKALGVKPTQMIKAMVCLAISKGGKQPILVMLNGECRLDFERIRAIINADRIVLADPKKAEQISGFKPGGTPPIGHRTPMRVIMDSRLAREEVLFGGGGTQDTVMKISPQEIIRITNATVGDISQVPNTSQKRE